MSTKPLTAKEALEIALVAKRNETSTKKVVASDDIFELSDDEREFHINFLMERISEAAADGKTSYKCHYSMKSEETGELVYEVEFFQAIALEFKTAYPHYQVIVDTGPRRTLLLDWSGKNEA